MKTGIELIEEERIRQISKEGWDTFHDDTHTWEELALAGAAYAIPERHREYLKNGKPKLFPRTWTVKWWKPTPDDRVKELVKAGALIAAEIDRLQRIKDKQ